MLKHGKSFSRCLLAWPSLPFCFLCIASFFFGLCLSLFFSQEKWLTGRKYSAKAVFARCLAVLLQWAPTRRMVGAVNYRALWGTIQSQPTLQHYLPLCRQAVTMATMRENQDLLMPPHILNTDAHSVPPTLIHHSSTTRDPPSYQISIGTNER
jgi:hypothetical protein